MAFDGLNLFIVILDLFTVVDAGSGSTTLTMLQSFVILNPRLIRVRR